MSIENEHYCLIKYSDVNGLFPNATFIEKVYQYSRPVRVGVHTEEVYTAERRPLTYDSHYEHRLIQATVYDKYQIKLIKREDYAYENLKYAQTISVYYYGDYKTYTPVILNIEVGQILDSTFQEVTIEFYDKNTDNYFGSYPVTSPLRSDVLASRKTAANLTVLELTGDKMTATRQTYYSAFHPELKVKWENIADSELNGTQVMTRITTKRGYELELYMTEADQMALLPLIAYGGGYLVDLTMTVMAHTYTAIERPEVVVEKVQGGYNLYKVLISIVTVVTDVPVYSYT